MHINLKLLLEFFLILANIHTIGATEDLAISPSSAYVERSYLIANNPTICLFNYILILIKSLMGYQTLFDSVTRSCSHLAQSLLQAVADRLHLACNHDLRRCKKSFAVSVADQPPNNHSFECRPRHGSLPVLSAVWRLGRVAGVVEVAEACRACWGCAARVLVLGMCLGGGDIMGDFDRLRDASRERLLERPRTRALIAPKKARDVGDVGDAGDTGGDIWSDDCECCDPTVFVRTGGTAWKLDWDVIFDRQCSVKIECNIRA